MALTLEPDFRSLKTAASLDPPERRAGKPGHGDDFANELRSARETGVEAADPGAHEKAIDPALLAAAQPAPATPAPDSLHEAALAAVTPQTPAAAVASGDLAFSEPGIDRDILGGNVLAEPQMTPAAFTPEALTAEGRTGPATEAPMIAPVTAPATNAAAPDALPKAQSRSPDAPREVSPAPGRNVAPPGEMASLAVAGTATPAGPAERAATPEARSKQSVPRKAEGPAGAPSEQPLASPLLADPVSAETPIKALTAAGDKAAESANVSTPGAAAISLAASAPAAPQAAPPPPAPVPMTPAHAILTASPAQIVDIVARTAEDGQTDRITVQLDPPELGRVSIDFKFDSQGLQHVTITSETPEAMRQLRQMHSELVQALERQGIGSQNMTFEHQQQQTPAPNPFARGGAINGSSNSLTATSPLAPENPQGKRTLPGGRLDIRL